MVLLVVEELDGTKGGGWNGKYPDDQR